MMIRYRRSDVIFMHFFAGAICTVIVASVLWLTAAYAAPEPHQQILDAVQALRQNDLTRLIQGYTTPEEFEKMAADWEAMKTQEVSDEDRAEFNASVGMLLAPDAENTIMALIQPQLEQMRETWSSQVPLYEGLAMMVVQGAENITPENKAQATKVIQAVAAWARENDLADVELARQAVREAIATAKKFGIQTLDEMNELSMEEILVRGGEILAGFKRILDIYGLSIDDMLDSVTAETLSVEGDTAKVKLGVELFGQPVETESELKLVDGRWVSPEAQESLLSMAPGGEMGSAEPATEVQTMPELTPTEDTAYAATIAGQPVAGLSAAEVYLQYRGALQQASTFDQIAPYWMDWVGDSAAAQDDAIRVSKLKSLQRSARNVQIIGEHYENSRFTLDVIGEDTDAQPLDGAVVLMMQDQQWRIDDISWAPRILAVELPEPEGSVVALPEAEAIPTPEPVVNAEGVAQGTFPKPASVEAVNLEPELTEWPEPSSVILSPEAGAIPTPEPGMNTEDVAPGSFPKPASVEAVNLEPELTEWPEPSVAEPTQPVQSEPMMASVNAQQPAGSDTAALQQTLDRNPFLKRYNVHITAVELADGFLTAEMTTGPASLLDQVRLGFDVIEDDLNALSDANDRQAALAVRKTLVAVKGKYDLLAVLVVASPDDGSGHTTATVQTANAADAQAASVSETPDNQPGVTEQPAETEKQTTAKVKTRQQANLEQERRLKAQREQVRQIQTRLNELGYDSGVPDGKAGPGTRRAIKTYQTAAGLATDGKPSQSLLTHLNSNDAVPNPATQQTASQAEEEPKEEGKLKKLFGNIFKKKKDDEN